MKYRIGEYVSVCVDPKESSLKGVILDTHYDVLRVKILDNQDWHHSKGDPVMIGYESYNNIYISRCHMLDYDKSQGMINIQVYLTHEKRNTRYYNRFPVTYKADVRPLGIQNEYQAMVKNIGLGDMMIHTNVDMQVNQVFTINVYADKTKIPLRAIAVRKVKYPDNYEYGVKTIFMDYGSKNAVASIIHTLKEKQRKLMDELTGDVQ